MSLRVERAAEGAGDPSAIWFGQRRVAVQAVVDRWWGAHQRWWKVQTAEGEYVLRLEEGSGAWDLAAVVGGS